MGNFLANCIIVILLACLSGSSIAASPSLNSAIKLLTESSKEKVKIAVLDFSESQSSSGKFSSFVADELTQILIGYRQVALIERRLVQQILKESQLHQLLGNEDSQTLSLFKADILLLGSYETEEKYLNIRGRFVAVKNSEILAAFSLQIKKPIIESQKKHNLVITDDCENKTQEIRTLLKDLSSRDKENKLIEKATAIPFDNQCGKIHYQVIYALQKLEIRSDVYHNFLRKTLNGINFPAEDDRAGSILRYWAVDHIIDEVEWSDGVAVVSRAKDYHIRIYLGYLLRAEKTSVETIRKRISVLMQLAQENKIGLPKPVSVGEFIFLLLGALGSYDDKNPIFQLELLENYANLVNKDPKNLEKLTKQLKSYYFSISNDQEPLKKRVLSNLIRFLKPEAPVLDLADEIIEILHKFSRDIEVPLNETEKKNGQIYQKHQKYLLAEIPQYLCHYIEQAKTKSQKESGIKFALANGIDCGNETDIAGIFTLLKSKDSKEMLNASELLLSAKSNLERYQDQISSCIYRESSDYSKKLARKNCIKMAAYLNDPGEKILRVLIDCLAEMDLSYEAKEVLQKIGIKAKPFLLVSLQKYPDDKKDYAIVELLAELGGNDSIASLKWVSQNHKQKHIRERALKAIRQIETEFE